MWPLSTEREKFHISYKCRIFDPMELKSFLIPYPYEAYLIGFIENWKQILSEWKKILLCYFLLLLQTEPISIWMFIFLWMYFVRFSSQSIFQWTTKWYLFRIYLTLKCCEHSVIFNNPHQRILKSRKALVSKTHRENWVKKSQNPHKFCKKKSRPPHRIFTNFKISKNNRISYTGIRTLSYVRHVFLQWIYDRGERNCLPALLIFMAFSCVNAMNKC